MSRSRGRDSASVEACGSETPPPAAHALDEALFRAWQSGDVEAREAAWTLLWDALSSPAVRFCRRFCRDHATAKDWASSAIADAAVDIERRMYAEGIAWPGHGPFLGWVSARVIFRCRDQCRDSLRWFNRIVELRAREADELEERLGSRVSRPPTQEEDLINGERERDGLRWLVRDLAALRELCRDSPSLLDVVDQMEGYLRHCLIESLPAVIDATSFTLDDLAEAARPDRVEATKVALYQWIKRQLNIDRNTLYQRMKRIHALLRGPLRLDDDRNRTSRRRKEQKRWLH
jgi:DNA-directed RNA polymerase specialized sigma24 family protein